MSELAAEANAEQAKLWNTRAGRAWVEHQAMLDRLFEPFEAALIDAVRELGAREVLDVGCGAGASSFAVARSLGVEGRCTGVDISAPLIAAAQRRAETLGATNTAFRVADAQRAAFEEQRFDAVISRFGVMFFDDPVAAFTNLRRATRTGGGLALIAWRGAADNPFMTAAERAAAPLLPELAPRQAEGPGQFAFADRGRVEEILSRSGWSDVEVAPLDVACAMSVGDLEAYISGMGPIGMLVRDLPPLRRDAVMAAVRQAFEPYVGEGVARFNAACWMLRAKNRR